MAGQSNRPFHTETEDSPRPQCLTSRRLVAEPPPAERSAPAAGEGSDGRRGLASRFRGRCRWEGQVWTNSRRVSIGIGRGLLFRERARGPVASPPPPAAISGTTQVGETLTVFSLSGGWQNQPTSFQYAVGTLHNCCRHDVPGGRNWIVLPRGAAADEGSWISATVTASNQFGQGQTRTATVGPRHRTSDGRRRLVVVGIALRRPIGVRRRSRYRQFEPVSVGSRAWSVVAAGSEATLAVADDGTSWSGANGLGTGSSRSR